MTRRRTLAVGLEILVPVLLLVGWQLYTVHAHSFKFPRLSTILVEHLKNKSAVVRGAIAGA